MRHLQKRTIKRGVALTLSLALILGISLPGIAADADEEAGGEPVPADVSVEETASDRKLNTLHGETYYATLDYYGGILDSSVVKSYKTYGNDTIVDYGVYDDVINLTDDLVPVVENGTVTFQLGEDAPSQFFFEGKTRKPMEEFPWALSLSYRLNGEPALAEDLAGEKGVVEIILDAVPNPAASEYSQNNVVLTAMSTLNGDDILSLEAAGAQIQQVGNLYCVMFMVMPGEERHFTIRVGAEDFTYSGMMLLAVPATLDQLSQIEDLREAKEKTEDSYDAIQDSMDVILDSLEGMSGNIASTADGLERINQGRETFSNGKNTIYDDTDTMRADLEALAAQMEPMVDQISALSQVITDSKGTLNEISDITISLKSQLQDMEDALEDLEDGKGNMEDLLYGLADMEGSLRRMERALEALGGSSSGDSSSGSTSSRELVRQVKAVHRAYEEEDLTSFMAQMLLINGTASSSSEATELAGKLAQLAALSQEEAQAMGQAENWAVAQELTALHGLAQAVSFQDFCEKLPGISEEQAKLMNDLWIVYDSGKVDSEEGKDIQASLGDALDLQSYRLSTASVSPMSNTVFGAWNRPAGSPVLNGALALSAIDGSELSSSKEDTSKDSTDSTDRTPTTDSTSTTDSTGADNSGGSTGSGDTSPDDDGTDTPTTPSDGGEDPVAPPEGTTPPSEIPSDESSSVGGAAIDLITSGLDSANDRIDRMERELKNTMKDIAGPTADVVGQLADLCDEINDVVDLLDDADDLSAALRVSTGKLQNILDLMDELRDTLNDYEPKLQETLTTVSGLISIATQSVWDMETMIENTENLIKSVDQDMDPGMEASLEGLIAVLRKSTTALNQTDTIRNAIDTIDALVKDEWDSHTGEDNNILLMDASAKPISLTDERNEGTTSIQYVMRTQEIQEEDDSEATIVAEDSDQGTLWSRIAAMFRDIWEALTGWL